MKQYQNEDLAFMWKDAQGGLIHMFDMDLDYMINCINICRENDLQIKEQEFKIAIAKNYPHIDTSKI